jgi:hypothetical protein
VSNSKRSGKRKEAAKNESGTFEAVGENEWNEANMGLALFENEEYHGNGVLCAAPTSPDDDDDNDDDDDDDDDDG